MSDAALQETDAAAVRPNARGRGAGGAGGAATVAISIDRVSKTYPVPLARLKRLFKRSVNPVTALTDVSFDVREGEIFGLIGRNGAGKTTLTKIVATLVQPTEGAVTVRGFDSVRDEERVRAQTGLASAEERSFYWRLTAEQNLTFFARLYGMSAGEARRRIAELLAHFELEGLARRRFGELSTGNKQRLAVARSMLNSPPVLLLDEPTRSLDPVAAARMRATIGALARSTPPVTILLTSHNLAEVEELCERVAVISRGRIRAVDTPAALRGVHRQRESVRITLGETTAERASAALDAGLDGLEVRDEGGGVVAVAFTREPGDAALDRAVRLLIGAGARVMSCESERATLLDVIEGYESDGAEAEGAGGGAPGEGVAGR
jgi:ABC-2 type transport system ATP-binding protein